MTDVLPGNWQAVYAECRRLMVENEALRERGPEGDRLNVIARWTVVKMFDGTWNVRDEQTGEWVPDAVHLSKPCAAWAARALNSEGAVLENEKLRAALEFYAEKDSEFDAGGVDGGERALEALGLPPLGGQ